MLMQSTTSLKISFSLILRRLFITLQEKFAPHRQKRWSWLMLALCFLEAISDSDLFPDSQIWLVITNLVLSDSFLSSESPFVEIIPCFPRKLEISQLLSMSSHPQKIFTSGQWLLLLLQLCWVLLFFISPLSFKMSKNSVRAKHAHAVKETSLSRPSKLRKQQQLVF